MSLILCTLGVLLLASPNFFAETRTELTQRAARDFSTRHECPLQHVSEGSTYDYRTRCSRENSCKNIWVIVGCGKKDTYTTGHRVPTDFKATMSHAPYIAPVEIEF